ncbi:MAG TPA: helicase-related protein, partial [Nitrospinota bacterium]|nr:helicase-related protein [Nitrospinota bacterium]
TLERTEIIRNLRLGKFDCLIGINLLREGLDIPEVSLVAILDADKEGFLRSERSLIQTIGRAARNINGKVLMYAALMTGSLDRAVFETNRRRKIQKRFNKKNNITPESVVKSISDILSSIYEADYVTVPIAEEPLEEYLTIKDISKKIGQLKKEMKEAAEQYDFERAAELRDRIFDLEERELELLGK